MQSYPSTDSNYSRYSCPIHSDPGTEVEPTMTLPVMPMDVLGNLVVVEYRMLMRFVELQLPCGTMMLMQLTMDELH